MTNPEPVNPWGETTLERVWRSGPWSVRLRGEELAELGFHDRTIVRSVRAIVRDRDWNTPEWVTTDIDEQTATLCLHLRSKGYDSHIAAQLRVSCDADRLTVTFSAVSESDWLTNRTGLVMLQSPRLAGKSLAVTHSDGSCEKTVFPEEISPTQPVFDIVGLDWQDSGVSIRTRFVGDVFEMEDQRNWTDASYKTYNRPLSEPFPYPLTAGKNVHQEIRIEAAIANDAPSEQYGDHLTLIPAATVPQWGVGASTAPEPTPTFTPLGDFVLVEVTLGDPATPAALTRAAMAGKPLDVRLILSDSDPDRCAAQLDDVLSHVATVPLVRVGVFSAEKNISDPVSTELLREALHRADRQLPVITGVRAHFTELNRMHDMLAIDGDAYCFSSTPLFHSTDSFQLVEAIAMQRLTAVSAVRIAEKRPVNIGPVTLRPRFNNVATTAEPLSQRSDLLEGYGAEQAGWSDPRQKAPALAAWTIASAAAFTVPGVESVTFFEQWGPRGIRTAQGEKLPVFDAVEALTELHGTALWAEPTPDGLLWALGCSNADGVTVLVANLDHTPRSVSVDAEGIPLHATMDSFSWTVLYHRRSPGTSAQRF